MTNPRDDTGDPHDRLGATLPQATGEVLPPPPREAEVGSGRVSMLIYHQAGVQAVSLAEGQRLVVGRDPEAEGYIEDQSLSRRHAAFDMLGGEVWVEDLGSTNGTRLDGEKIQRARLSQGAEALLGSVTVSLHVLRPSRGPGPGDRPGDGDGVDSHDAFGVALADEILRARTFNRPATLLMLAAEGSGAKTLAGLHASTVRSQLRPVDRLAQYGPNTLEVLLCESGPDRAQQLTQSLAGSGPAAADLRCGIAAFPEAGTSAEELLAACRDALRRTTATTPVQTAHAGEPRWTPADPDGPIACSPAMREVFATVDRLAPATIPVLLLGDTGTGKEVVARALHDRSARAARPMACINCGAIPPTLVESVLFGHEKGAFTGASQQNKGLFEEANGGTLLLDEIGELSGSAQATLLRALETHSIRRVGSNQEIAVDVRIVAATHRDLEQMCHAGSFRWDLFYRLNVMILTLPPLADRVEDIAPLVERFLHQAREANHSPVVGIEPDALGQLHRYGWPGNIRELKNAIERAVVIAPGQRITLADLPERVRQTALGGQDNWGQDHANVEKPPAPSDRIRPSDTAKQLPADYKSRVHRFERELMVEALKSAGWNRGVAARHLGMPVRTLSHRMKKLGIERE